MKLIFDVSLTIISDITGNSTHKKAAFVAAYQLNESFRKTSHFLVGGSHGEASDVVPKSPIGDISERYLAFEKEALMPIRITCQN